MALDLVQIRKLAERKENENLRFRRFLKECDVEAGEIDQRVFDITHRVWAGIDCITCANGCRELRPTFSEDEVERVARRLGMERDVFIKTYLDRPDVHEANPWQTRTTPFSFLKSSLCTNGPSVPKSSATSVLITRSNSASRWYVGAAMVFAASFGGAKIAPESTMSSLVWTWKIRPATSLAFWLSVH